MSERQPWFCPACQKHHGPHVDTCPIPADAIGTKYLPPIQPWTGGTPVWIWPDHDRSTSDPCAGCNGPCANAACPKRAYITCGLT